MTQHTVIDTNALATITIAVVAFTQLLKWMGTDDKHGPWLVLLVSLLGVTLYGFSFEVSFSREMVFTYFTSWITVATSAAGVFGFTRATKESIMGTDVPPGGAGQSPTNKEK